MKKLRAIVGILALVVTMSVAVDATETAAAKVLQSIARIDIYMTSADGMGQMRGACTAFSINEQKDLFMTAAHCVDEGTYTVDKHIAWLAYFNEEIDVAILVSPGAARVALKPSTIVLDHQQDIFATGYAFGFETPMVLAGKVASFGVLGVDEDFPKQVFMVTRPGVIGGMSGGPLTDALGDVISVNQMTGSWNGTDVAFSRPQKVVMDATKQFWGK